MRYKSSFADYFKEPKEEKKKVSKPTKVKLPRYRFELSIGIEDKDVIDKLESVGNKSEYIRTLVRKDIKKRD